MERTRRTLQEWSARDSAPLLALQWDAQTGGYSRLTDREDPTLRDDVMALLETDTFEAMDRAMLAILRRVR
jgi:hypothetical protein